VNPAHPVIEHLNKLHARDATSVQVTEWIELLHDQALLTEGSPLEDPNRFAKRMTALLTQVSNGAATGAQATDAASTPAGATPQA
jgi:molecular chaperone HtpG